MTYEEVRQHHNDPAVPALSHDNDAECVLENVDDFRADHLSSELAKSLLRFGSDASPFPVDTVAHQWDASVAKKSDGLGVCLESLKTEEHVKVILMYIYPDGAVQAFNAEKADLALRIGDEIQSVNGVASSDEEKFWDELSTSTVPTLSVERGGKFSKEPTFWNVEVRKETGMKLGLQLDQDTVAGAALGVMKVLPGTTVHAANGRRPEKAIRAGDLIYAVNEVRGDTEKMFVELQKSDSLSFLMCRRPVIF